MWGSADEKIFLSLSETQLTMGRFARKSEAKLACWNHWISKWSSEVSSQNRTHKNPFENPLHGCIVRGGEMEELQTQNDQSSKVWKLSFNQTAPWASGDGFGPARDCSHGGSSGGVEQELLGLDPGNPDVHRCRPRPVHLLRLGGEGGRIQRATRGPPHDSCPKILEEKRTITSWNTNIHQAFMTNLIQQTEKMHSRLHGCGALPLVQGFLISSLWWPLCWIEMAVCRKVSWFIFQELPVAISFDGSEN